VGEKEKADAASLTGRSETRVQKSFPNRLTPGEIKKSPGPLLEPGLLSKIVAYFEQNKWRPLNITEPLDALDVVVLIIAFLPFIGQGLRHTERPVRSE